MFDRKAIQADLDTAAEELDKKGLTDLADKVDFYSNLLNTASDKALLTVKKIAKRGLQRVQAEVTNREKSTSTKSTARKALIERLRARKSRVAKMEKRAESLKKIRARRAMLDRIRARREAAKEKDTDLRAGRTSRIRSRMLARIRARRNSLLRNRDVE